MSRKIRLGLALDSGGARGFAHIPLLEKLDELAVQPFAIAGSSIGALVAAVYGCGNLQAYRDAVFNMSKRELFMLTDPVFPRTGLFSGDRLMKFMTRFIPEGTRIEELPFKLGVVATDYQAGAAVVFTSGDLLQAVRASIAIPGVFTPVVLGDTVLIDGGVTRSLPVDVVKRMDVNRMVAVNLHPPVSSRRIKKLVKQEEDVQQLEMSLDDLLPQPVVDPESTDVDFKGLDSGSAPPGFWNVQSWFRRWRRDSDQEEIPDPEIPSIFESITRSLDIMSYAHNVMMLKYNQPDVLIQPEVQDIPQLEFVSAAEAYRLGQEAVALQEDNLLRRLM